MYKIIGGDGKEYGPVPAHEVRRWIAEGRANAQTRAAVEGAVDWKPLAAFPEFSLLFAPAPVMPPTFAGLPVRKSNSMAMTGMIMGILSLTVGLCCHGLPFNIVGLVLSAISLVQIKKNPELYEGQGMAIAGLILSALSILLGVLLFLIAAIADHWTEVPRTYRL